LLEDGSIQLENILSDLEKERLEAVSLLLELQKREQKLSETERIIHNKEIEVDKKHRLAKSSAVSEAEKIILKARREAENLITDIRENQADKKSIQKTKNWIENKLCELQSEKELDILERTGISKEEAIVDTAVFIPNLNMEGKIVHPPNKQYKVSVLANGITLSLKLSALQLSLQTEKPVPQKNQTSLSQVEPLQSIQIDLRGKRVGEALFETEKFLDTAILSGVEFVNILHGKGTGALMETIHEYLKDQPFVQKYHFADDDQGGVGITVVKLK